MPPSVPCLHKAEEEGKPGGEFMQRTENVCVHAGTKQHQQSLPSLFDWCKLCKSSETLLRGKQGEGVVSWCSCVCVSLRVFLPSPMSSKSSVASSSSSSAAAAAAVSVGGEAPPGFSREEQAALQWALLKKEREPTKVRVCGARLAVTSLFFVFSVLV